MAGDGWLSKDEVNAHYYNTVAGEISFATEAGGGDHSVAVARLIGAHAGRAKIRVLELGANNCAFARLLIEGLWEASGSGENELAGIEYVAVEYSRASLEEALRRELDEQLFERAGRGTGRVVATMGERGDFEIELTLVHSDANEFMRSPQEPFDFVILNELLDDLPYRAYFTDAQGQPFEAVPRSRGEDGRWTIRVDAEPAGPDGLPPETVTAQSPESVELVAAAAAALKPGGMLLIHDYGFAEPFLPLETYAAPQPSLPGFAELELPAGEAFPRGFFRVFGNEAKHVVQVTNDVNFAELAAVLDPAGTVITIPHGNAIVNQGGRLQKGDGTFLGEFGELAGGDDLDAVLARLAGDQARIRDEFTAGRGTVFLDLIYVKGAPTGT
jgi:SAM-dependent methyltransferase